MKIVQLPEVSTIIMGQSPPSTSYNSRGEGLPFFQGKADFGDLHPTIRMFCTEPNKIAEAGDILISVRAPVGPTNIAPVKCCIGRGLAAIRNLENLEKLYLLYFLRFYEPKLVENGTGSTFDAVSRSDLEAIQLPLPPLDEQKRIAAILSKADRLRRLRRYARELSDGYLQSVFLEMFGDYLCKQTETTFKDVFEIPLQNGLFEKNDQYGTGIPVIWVDNLYHTISIETKGLRRARLDDNTIKKFEVLEGDLLFTRSSLVREGIGQINIVPNLIETTTFECHVIRGRVDRKVVNPYYILFLYRSPFGKNAILQRSKTATMTTIGQEDLRSLPCPIPPLPLQQKFAQVVQKTERLHAQQRESARQGEHLFQSLLQRAFRGEL